MALVKKPVTGMKDILPEEMQIRDYVVNIIKETYRSFGFTPIETLQTRKAKVTWSIPVCAMI